MECDDFLLFHSILLQNFNSRTHVECDRFPFQLLIDRKDFNSRTHVECDLEIRIRRIFP